ncbi:16S rRNA (guanine(966)-N(2))-methyltransferase RsmD [Helcococcus ovis]|uniref:16S rRNA (Guanine(966)-N(2))-methyltransferase RsmD n=1 Tax=Helcococcus ovis TaxID=72026 RepID=A0A4R9C2H8_9FIRM|nr:16S rRNA (guanine(966)-N(2))-methyltransferase RsmD [Helcococcus ovis]TFF64896.1 16S rRNA (guanine(966)-N(2))-methyltransferase RsmD [Helcococcus ovis]TFF67173.1 16S rRNA (guanine(966)-N(2))-methyltransferase RsmD [Helcococcus ovis]TFF67367.1 16S rRNA (guanine(966)-N(2))-methyltransferase RsmD [Helcococcus ovis]WNZ01886.1 16S rRNA (guanine(966)-N(2))-methyltransferase RsmD [Helcococcus ovis]
MALRVITGLRKGHKLKGPKGESSRPTEDRIKEAIFNIIGSIEENEVVLDLFACTGNIGIEFLSRGAKKVYFSECDRYNLSYMEDNIIHTKFEDKSVILRGDFRKNLMQIRENIDYVYLDPPYKSDFYEKAFEYMIDNVYFNNSLFIVEIDKNIDFSEIYDKLDLVYEKKYGRKYIKFYREKV